MAEALICTQCGSHKIKLITDNQYICDSCGTTSFISNDSEDLRLKLNIAMTTRQTAKFDEAKVLYQQIKSTLNSDQKVPEVYFGLFACEYKVLFELDNRTGNRVPIFYSSSETNVFDNLNLRKALEQAKDISYSKFQEYNELANKVESARMSYQKLVKLVTPFDIFICFKKTDLDGISDTRDYSTAMSLYMSLVTKFPKYKIFFSEKTLAEIPLTEYEPNIYYALHTAKILIVVSSKRDYLESQWVKNEWTRFLAINKANAIIPIYLKGSNVNIFPTEILKNNAYEEADYERIFKSIDSIMNSEKNVIERELEEEKRKKQLIDELEKRVSKSFNPQGSNLSNMFKRLSHDLSDGIFESAQKTCDAILNIDAEQPLAWFYSFLIENEFTSTDDLSSLYESDWTEDRQIRRALDFSKMEGYEEERKLIEDQIYKWINFMVTEAKDLRERKKYDDAKSKLVKIATHVEEFGRDQRYDYFYQSFLLENNCVNTNDLVSLLGIEKNTYFSKAMNYATDNQLMELQHVLSVAKSNASQYQEAIESNNSLLIQSLDKLDDICENKINECKELIEASQENINDANNDIHELNAKMKIEKDGIINKQNQIKEDKQQLMVYYSSFSEKLTRFFCNMRAIVLATALYALAYAYMPNFIIISYTYIIPLFVIAVLLNWVNIKLYQRLQSGDSIKGFIIFGIISGVIILEIPLFIGHSRHHYYSKMSKEVKKFDDNLERVDEEIKSFERKKKAELQKIKDFIDRRQDYIVKINDTIKKINTQSKQLREEYQVLSLNEGIILKVKLEKDIKMFKESMVKLDDQIYQIAQLKL